MKRMVSFILTLAMSLGFFGMLSVTAADDGSAAPVPQPVTYSSAVTDPATYCPQGDGSAENPYQIASADDLLWMARQHAFTDADGSMTDHKSEDAVAANLNPFKDKYLVQTADIDLGGRVLPCIGLFNNNYTEILTSNPGSVYSVFGGTYDGQGYSISNGYTARINPMKTELELPAMVTSRGGHGLFGIIDGATIKNVNLKNFKLYTDNVKYISCTGLLVGIALDNALADSEYNLIENCTTDEACGITYTGGTSRTEGNNDIHIHGRMGGLIGSAARTTVRNCVNNADITVGISHAWIGGLIGSIIGGTVENCVNNGNINIVNAGTATPTKRYRMIGGIVGGMPHCSMDAYNTLIDGCMNTGDISMDAPAVTEFVVGGILGGTRRTAKMRLTISNSANTGTFRVTAAEDVAYAEGAIIGAVQVWSNNRITQPQTIDVRLTGVWSVAMTELSVSDKKLADCIDGEGSENANEISRIYMDDGKTLACTWVNLGPKNIIDDNGELQNDNAQKVVDACLTKSGCTVDTAERIMGAMASASISAAPYRIQTYTSGSGKTGAIRVIASVYDTNAERIGVELVSVSDGTVAVKAETTSLYTSYLSDGAKVTAPAGSYFTAVEMDTSALEGRYELRVYTVDADGNVIQRPAIRSLEFKRGNLK